jgi:hypothetical protein
MMRAGRKLFTYQFRMRAAASRIAKSPYTNSNPSLPTEIAAVGMEPPRSRAVALTFVPSKRLTL